METVKQHFVKLDLYGHEARVKHLRKSIVGAITTVLTMTGILSWGLYVMIG
jgi:hypothetical protein